MHQLELREAKSRLDELVDKVANGEEVVITRRDGAAFKIVSVKTSKPTPKYGSAKGLIELADDFDDPLDDFKAYDGDKDQYWQAQDRVTLSEADHRAHGR